LLFAVAGVILGVSHPVLDSWQQGRGGQQPRGGADPSWTLVLAAIALFVLQYAASGGLEGPLLGQTLTGGLPTLDIVLAAAAVAIWWAFDATPQGLAMACLTAVAGPAVEVALINGLHLYAYTHPAVLGVPTWIAWVYFAGGPAVGNLGRRVSSSLVQRRRRHRAGEA
jgi:peptidoglycan/LPS O-acetylase OafA/YrhL